jgi:prepilin peptidase CpaA
MIFFAIALTILMLAVVYFDITKFIIPNTISVLIIGLWPVYFFLAPYEINWTLSLAVMLGVFLFGLLIFTLNIMGGGDVKLFTALSLWIGWQPFALIQFFTWVAIAGGILALFKLLMQFLGRTTNTYRFMPHFIKEKGNIPYGIAIAFSFLFLLWNGIIIKNISAESLF